jgi:outer membrane protein assembly factor BamB
MDGDGTRDRRPIRAVGIGGALFMPGGAARIVGQSRLHESREEEAMRRRVSTAVSVARDVLWSGLLVAPLVAAACKSDGTGPGGNAFAPVWVSPKAQGAADWVGGTPAVEGGRVYVQDGNQLVGLDAASGTRLWSRAVRIGPAPPPTTLLARDGVVYLSETDSIMAINGASGATLWTVHPDSQAVAVPALDATTLYTGQRGVPVVYALSRTSGALRWKVNLGPGYSFRAHVHGVAVSGDTVYAAMERYLDLNGVSATGVLVALASVDGHELWRYETPGTKDFLLDAPLPAGHLIIINDAYGGDLVAVDVTSHQEVWRTPVGGAVGTVLVGSTLYTAGSDANARALDLTTGTVRWSAATGSSAFGIGTCNGNFYVSAFHLRRYDPASGQITGEASVGPADGGFVSHVAADGTRVYAVGTGGTAAFLC